MSKSIFSKNAGKKRKQEKKASSLARGALSLDPEFDQELRRRVHVLRSGVDDRSLIREGTGQTSPRRSSAPTTPMEYAKGSQTLPNPSTSGAMSSHDLKQSRKNLQLRLKQSELEETARSLASCRHYPIPYSSSRSPSSSATTLPITPRTAAAASSAFVWDDYWEERKQVEKVRSPMEAEKETDIDEDINERQSNSQWLKRSGFQDAAECVDNNKAIDMSKVRERTQTMKLTSTDAAAIMKQVKRINATVKSGSPDTPATGVHNGKTSPDRDLISLASFLEGSAEGDMRSSTSEGPEHPEHFECVSGNADTVDPSTPLPVLVLAGQLVGVTYMDDLSEVDQSKICHVAVLTLTALLDTYDLRWKTGRPVKRKGADTKDAKMKIFGVPLTAMIERDRQLQAHVPCPLFFTEICDFLAERGATEEGILRKPGSESRMKKLREELEDIFCEGRFSWADRFPHDCATLLKQFLRELPVALLTEEYLPMFETIEHIPSRSGQLMVLNLLTLLLPSVHRACLKVLLQRLYHITTLEDRNRMGLSSVAMIIAPNLFRHRPCTDPTNEAKIAARESYITQLLIVYHELLFVVPNALLEQLRCLNEAEAGNNRKAKNVKEVKKVLNAQQRKHDTTTPLSPSATLPQMAAAKDRRVLKVYTPLFSSRVSFVMEINEATTASDALIQFCKKQFGVSPTSEAAISCSLDSLNDTGRLKGKRAMSESTSSSSCDDVRSSSSSSETMRSATPEHSPPAFDIYECAGNISYRRLRGDALILSVLRSNPAANIAILRCKTPDLTAVLKSVAKDA